MSILPFVLDQEKNFTYPWFLETGQNPSRKQTASIIPDFTNGETDEFQNENYQKAVEHYLSALSKSHTPEDSAKTLNAIGRVLSKMKQFDKEYLAYSSIFPGLSKEISPAGIPFSYFAISQLIKLPLPHKQAETVRLAEHFLEQLDKGLIPLNPGTKSILEEITGWLSVIHASEEQVQHFTHLSESISTRLNFISNYGSKIRDVIVSNRQSELPEIIRKYNAFGLSGEVDPELIVIDLKRENPAGFVLSLKSLWKIVIDQLPEAVKSEYNFELALGGNIPENMNELSSRTELSPFFPLNRIVIKLANEKLVEEYVRKRSWTYGIALALLLGGMSLGIVLILRDIKREKKIAEMQSEFIANVTHELKTPLTSISMFAETIFLDRAKSEEIRKKYSNIIMKESEVLKRKIDNILEYSVRKNEITKYRIQETNLSMLVGEVMYEMKYWLDINNFEVHTEIEENLFAWIDPEAIKQALTNLIGNAIKYSPLEKRLVVRMNQKDDKIIIEVQDSGMGIPKDQISLVFEKFYRVRSHENESTTGTGLGLSVTRDIVKAHKGEILVESEINKGSKFTIWLNS